MLLAQKLSIAFIVFIMNGEKIHYIQERIRHLHIGHFHLCFHNPHCVINAVDLDLSRFNFTKYYDNQSERKAKKWNTYS